MMCSMQWFQGSLLDADGVAADSRGRIQRTTLDHGAWVDHCPGWLAGADALFERLRQSVPWRTEQRQMYDRIVDVPRLVRFYSSSEELPDPLLEAARNELSAHYREELAESFRTAGLCYYRDGNDSVAWHGDRIGRGRDIDTMVAIVSLGSPRRLSLRPRGGGKHIGYPLGHGDLLVMGGSCQRTWDHAVLKTSRAVGARISVQFRPQGVL